jgi:hypothetical protein
MAAGKIDTWDYQWFFAAFKNDSFSIFPGKNMVKNLGFIPDATHTVNTSSPMADLPVFAMSNDLNHSIKISRDAKFENEFVKRVWAEYKGYPLKKQLGFLYHKLFKEKNNASA